ncbi:velvet factor-domain-containing protein [Roridomyces roridus]|uniref:Velvet factor-domain-containing protein n=1 Tax=Roridomyces roridus TaxID=1738132 RepID=A0AAD7FZT7_9AGAR|nr:velvet factor-domain-containing protein [Roridomyces roridus]
MLPRSPLSSVNDFTFEMVIPQMPTTGRASGKSPTGASNDLLPHPIPVVQLLVCNRATKQRVNLPAWLVPKFTLFVYLVQRDDGEQVRFTPDRTAEALSGCHISSLFPVDLDDGSKSLYFAFPDLGVRCSGDYRFKFVLKVDNFDPRDESDADLYASVKYSNEFRIFTSTGYGGVQNATDLTRLLAEWGVHCRIRTKARGTNSAKQSTGVAPRKRSRRAPSSSTSTSTATSNLYSAGGPLPSVSRALTSTWQTPKMSMPRHLRTPPSRDDSTIYSPQPRYPRDRVLPVLSGRFDHGHGQSHSDSNAPRADSKALGGIWSSDVRAW